MSGIVYCLMVFYLYFFIVGYLTLLESKILGMIQLSSGPSSMSILNIYHFFLDFMKIILKGGLGKMFSKYYFFYFNLMEIISLTFGISLIFPTNSFGINWFYSYFSYLFFDGLILILKIYVMNVFSSSFSEYSSSSIKKIYIFLEGGFIGFYFYILFLGVSLGFKSWTEFSIFSGTSLGIFTVYLLILFILMVLKIFSAPFDYFEMESEFVGGNTLEFWGIGFSFWSLLEYGLMLNSALFLSGLVNSFFHHYYFKFSILFLFLYFLFCIFFISGVFMSMSFLVIFWAMIKIYYFLIVLFLTHTSLIVFFLFLT